MAKAQFSANRANRSLTSHYSTYLLYEPCAKEKLAGVEVALCTGNTNTGGNTDGAHVIYDAPSEVTTSKLVVPDVMFCNCCQTHFADRKEQLNHYKCDWHRYNLHQRMKGIPHLTEDDFENIAGDVSSISGSDDDSDMDAPRESPEFLPCDDVSTNDDTTNPSMNERQSHKVFFKNEQGELISLYRCLLHHKKNPVFEAADLVTITLQLPDKQKWAIMMMSSGHFAAAVFDGREILEHKTFHRYTVRAKAGTSQSSKDNQSRGPHRSAGASLRRYNEMALIQEVQQLMADWSKHLETCDYIFVKVPINSRGAFYKGKSPILKKGDPRIRIVPFATRRPTFSEIKRVHQMLASVECYGLQIDVGDVIPVSPPRMYVAETGRLEVRDPQARQKVGFARNRKQPSETAMKAEDSVVEVPEEIEATAEVEVDLVEMMEEVDFSHLKEFSSKPKRSKHKKEFKASREVSTSNDSLDEDRIRWRNQLYTACKTGDTNALEKVLTAIQSSHGEFEASADATSTSPGISLKANSQEENIDQLMNPDSKSKPRQSPSLDNLGASLHGETVERECQDKNFADHDDHRKAQVGLEVTVAPDHSPQVPMTTNSTSSHEVFLDSGSAEKHQIHNLKQEMLNMSIGDSSTTFLHLAAKEGHPEMVTALLHAGADPAIKDKSGKTPYTLGAVEVRNAFRRFMANFPDRYDYVKAQVPSPLTAEMEDEKSRKAAEKRKARKKAFNERNKEKKATEAKLREENQEKERFLALSDREKRALAAERRMLQQHDRQGTSIPTLSRCWKCGMDITGKVPFEYCDYKFCTTKCLREHRASAASS